MYNIYIFSTLVLNILNSAFGSNLEFDGWATVNFFHALEDTVDPIFTERGNLSIQSLRSGSHVINQIPLSSIDIAKLKELAAKNKHYQLKSAVMAADGTTSVFYSTVKACMLAEAELNDIISVSLDYSGRIIAVALAIASTTTCEGATVPTDNLKEFKSSVFMRYTYPGPIPDTASYMLKLEREKEAKEKGELKDNRSFLAKYWMYILLVAVVMVLSSGGNPEAGAAGEAAKR